MSPPPKCCIVVVCENERTNPRDGATEPCGEIMIVTRGDELPYCHRCKKRDRVWRLMTEQEIAANDAAFLQLIERMSVDGHLGAAEQS